MPGSRSGWNAVIADMALVGNHLAVMSAFIAGEGFPMARDLNTAAPQYAVIDHLKAVQKRNSQNDLAKIFAVNTRKSDI